MFENFKCTSYVHELEEVKIGDIWCTSLLELAMDLSIGQLDQPNSNLKKCEILPFEITLKVILITTKSLPFILAT